MKAHIGKCPYRGRPFTEITPQSTNTRFGRTCLCFVTPATHIVIDPAIDWHSHVNLYVTRVTNPKVTGYRARLVVHNIGSIPGTALHGRHNGKALEVLLRDERSTRVWLANSGARACELAARLAQPFIDRRNKNLPDTDGGFPLARATRGGIRYTVHTPEGGLPPGHHVARIREVIEDDHGLRVEIDPVTGVSESVLDATAASTRKLREAATLVAAGGWCAPTEVAYALGLVPPRPKTNPDDYEWRKTLSAENGVYGKCHVATKLGDPDEFVALCTAANGEPTRVGTRDADKLEHEGRCRRCLHYIGASGGAVPPHWPNATNVVALKKETAMGHIDRATRLREEAERMLNQAAELENRPSEPEPDDEGNAIVWIRVWFDAESDRHYDYAAIRTAAGQWYTTGAERAGSGATWERLVDHFYDSCPRVEMWQASEFYSIGAKG